MKTSWNHIKQQLLEEKITPLHYCYLFRIENISYYSSYALDCDNKNLHILWTINELENSVEIIAKEVFFEQELFSHIDFDEERLIVLALNKVIDPTTSAIRIHYKEKVETIDCINGFIIKNYVCKTPNTPGHDHIHKGNILDDDTNYYATHYQFLINGIWENGVGKLPITEKQVLQIMLQSTGLKEFEFFTEENFPVRSYEDLDFKGYIEQTRFCLMGDLNFEIVTNLGKEFIVRTQSMKLLITDSKKQVEFDNRVCQILFSMFDHYWDEETSKALYEFSKKNSAYFYILKNAISCLKSWDWVDNDLKRFGLKKERW